MLTGEADEQEHVFHDAVRNGGALRLFGAVHSRLGQAGNPGEARVRAGRQLPDLTPGPRTAYRRWWNHPWSVVELRGQANAAEWTDEDRARLDKLVDTAHRNGLWIRFYTLNGHDPSDRSGGWTASYNFGSRQAAEQRWAAAVSAGVDFVAVDQYEDFARVLRKASQPMQLTGSLTYADYEQLFERTFDVPAGIERIDVDLPVRRYRSDGDGSGAACTIRYAGLEWRRIAPDLRVDALGDLRLYARGHRARPMGDRHRGSEYPQDDESQLHGDRADVGVDARMADLETDTELVCGRSPYAFRAQRRTHDAADWCANSRYSPEHVFNAAKAAGLDFVGVCTDHNTASHWSDVDRLQSLYPGLLLLHGREVTTYRGHMNAFGATTFVDFRLRPDRPIGVLATELVDGGAFVSINHPERPDDETCMGCGWNDRDDDTIRHLQGVEIVNGDLAEGKMAGWPFWRCC